MFCTHCGSHIDESSKYCPSCGKSIYEMKKSKKPLILVIISIVAIIALITTIIVVSEIEKKNTVIEAVTNDAKEQGLVNFDVLITGKASEESYNVTIECNELRGKTYEEIYKILYRIDSNNAIVSLVVNGDKYQMGSSKLYKNGKTVYIKSKSQTCEQCSRQGTNSYTNPFSGEIEWYCNTHYKKLKDMLDQIGIN